MGSCCICAPIENSKTDQANLRIELNDSGSNGVNPFDKHLSIVEYIEAEKEHDNNETNGHQKKSQNYQLNDLRSLEGVARLWSKKLQSDTKLLLLAPSKSVPIQGNMYTAINERSPISISTYFFQHAPRNQLNLLRSHSDHIGSSPEKHEMNNQKNKPKTDEYVFYETIEARPPQPVLKKQQFSLSTSNLRSARLMNLSPILSDDDEDRDEEEMKIEIITDTEEQQSNYGIAHVSNSMIREEHEEEHIAHDPLLLKTDDFMEYTSSKNIGFGASGVVKKAFHFSSCKMLAIKQCRSTQPNKLKAFQKEANFYKEFQKSPYIVDIIGFGKGKKNNELLMALEYMDLNSCKSLNISSKIEDIAQRELVVGHIALNVLKALECIHCKLYVHNDVKPDNILVNKYGEIKLSDFDTVLKLQHKQDLLTKNNGTQKYQSPEKIICETSYNSKTDIWSLGITAYELLFGDEYQKNNHYDEVSYVTNPPILNPQKHGLSVHCCDFVNQCLNVHKEQRPSATDLLSHPWFVTQIKLLPLKDRWPYLINLDPNKRKYHEDLLFMIKSLIIHYSARKFTEISSPSFPVMHKNISNKSIAYTDEERIENMAKYAFCTKDTVIDRIRVTVAYIKSQLNKVDKS